MSDRAPPVEGQGPREQSNPPVAKRLSHEAAEHTADDRVNENEQCGSALFLVDSLESKPGPVSTRATSRS